jgi:hypothetical protein
VEPPSDGITARIFAVLYEAAELAIRWERECIDDDFDGRDLSPRRVEDQLRTTVHVTAPPAKPLPVIVSPIVDELLSSWLKRTAHIYGVSARDVLTHFGVKPPDSLRQVDFAQPLEVKTRLAWGLRTNAARIQRAGHPIPIRHANELIAIALR